MKKWDVGNGVDPVICSELLKKFVCSGHIGGVNLFQYSAHVKQFIWKTFVDALPHWALA